MPNPPFQSVAIVGVGLIGGSVALAIRDRGLANKVIGFARTEEAAKRLESLGVVDQATSDLATAVQDADLVVVASPVDTIAELVVKIASSCKQSTLITDAGSTKQELVESISSQISDLDLTVAFVGAHPMAGDHQSGAEAARADLFEGALAVLTPTENTAPEATEATQAFWQSIGCRTTILSPEDHDRLVAAASHLPHVAAAALASVTPNEALPLTATGWGDTTRVAAGSPQLWREILLANQQATIQGLKALQLELQAYTAALEAGDAERLEKLLEQAKGVRERRDALGS